MPKGLIGRVCIFLVGLVVIAELLSVVFVRYSAVAVAAGRSIDTGSPVALPWPAYGQAALSAKGLGIIEQSGSTTPAPTASVAKIITALAVLKQKPLNPGETGPQFTVGQADVNNYQQYISQDGSVVQVQLGEVIDEHQALEAMLLPSANNMAYSLASWVFGSLDSYVAYANQFVKTLGMDNTHVADASGFSPQTTSTAADLTKLAEAALTDPVLAAIVNEQQADVPVAGTVRNTNLLLGQDGIIGIKTGNTNEAGGCYLFAANRPISGQTTQVFGAILGAPDLRTAMVDSRTLIMASDNAFRIITPADTGQEIAVYNSTWGARAPVIAHTSLSMLLPSGQAARIAYTLKPLPAGAHANTPVGNMTLKTANRSISAPLLTAAELKKPSIKWRLLHPSF